jgi:AcrR family transcriptional regulator
MGDACPSQHPDRFRFLPNCNNLDMAAQKPAAPHNSFIHGARRAQLVGSAIEVIAQAGLDRASVVRIAQHAKVSRGVVNYHFTDKDDLVDSVIEEVYRVGEREVGPGVNDAPTPRDALLAFVGGSIDFYAAYPMHMAALVEIFAAARRTSTRARASRPRHTKEMSDVAALLRAGQQSGQFRAFDTDVVADLIRSMLDAAVHTVAATGETEPMRAELLAAVDAITGGPK